MTRYTDEERKALITLNRPWIESIRPLMLLDHWRIKVSDERPGDSGAIAEMAQYMNAGRGIIRIGDWYFDLPPDEQAETIVHEYLHCFMKPLKHAFFDIEFQMSKPTYAAMSAQFYHAEEITVDHLSRVICPHIPSPPPLPREMLKEYQEPDNLVVGAAIDPPREGDAP